MIIRKAKADDSEAMAAILNEIIAIGGTTAYQTPVAPDYFGKFISNNDPKVFAHVAEDHDLLGFQWMEPDTEGLGAIATFAKPGITQRGIGSALFEATQETSRATGYKMLEATIRADNAGGLRYYTKMGFRDHTVFEAVPLSGGTKVDRIQKLFKL